MYIRNKVHGIQERNHVNHSILAPELKTSKRMNNSFVHKANNPIIITIMMVVSTTETDIAPHTKIFLSSLTCLCCFLSTKTKEKIKCFINDFAYFTAQFYRMNKNQMWIEEPTQLDQLKQSETHKNEEINVKISST